MVREVSIIIPVHEDLRGLQLTIQDLKNWPTSNWKTEIIVCNDGHNAEIEKYCTQEQVKHLATKPAKGSYFARNMGIAQAQFNQLLFIDAEVRLQGNYWEMLQHIEAPYAAFQINMLLLKTNTFHQYSLLTEFQAEQYFTNNHFGPTAFLLVDKSVFQEIGMFNDQLKSGGDMEFGYRCFEQGIKQIYVPNNHVFHYTRTLWAKWKKEIRVLTGIKKLHQLYPERAWNLYRIEFKKWFMMPIRILWNVVRYKKQTVYKNWKQNDLLFIFNILIHQILHFKAYTWVLLKKVK